MARLISDYCEMEEKHRIILRYFWANIRRNLEPRNILPKLVSVLIETDEEEIKVQSTRQERCDKLLEILPRKGPNAFKVFVEALKEEAPHLASDLSEADRRTGDEFSPGRETSAKLRGEIRNLKTELEAEKHDHIQTSQELRDLESLHEALKTKTSEQIQKLAEIIQQLRDERDSARGENQTLKNEIQELKNINEDYQRENQALQKNLENVKKEQENLQLFSENLKEAEKEQEEKIRQLQGKNDELQNEVTNKTSELRELAERIQQHRDERDSARGENQTLKNEIQELKNISEDYQRENQALQKNLENVKKEQENLQLFSENLKEGSEKEQEEKIRQLQRKNDELQNEVTNKTSELRELAESIQQHRDERDSARGENQTLKNEIQELKNISEDYQRENQALQENLESVKEERGNLQLLSDNLEATEKKQQQKVRRLQRKNTELENKVSQETSQFQKMLACEKKKKKKLIEELKAEAKAKDVLLENMSAENKRLHEESNAERSTCDRLREEVRRLNLRLSRDGEMAGCIFNYARDFDTNGVVYTLVRNFGRLNSTQARIIATRSSDQVGKATDILENRVDKEIVSGTMAQEESWWCVDLTENYALYLTHYTLRHGYNNSLSFLLNWRLEGSLDGHNWKTLRSHDGDRGLKGKERYQTFTWRIDGKSNASRYFRILQTGKNSTGNFGIFLSGIELYGVLVKIGKD